ncbi:MAG TPA: DUF2817 domain-containing protein [Spirochaetota bacterium]|nr:DUF2817 domain-containing protein [Spirochaetota bacterium]HOS33039.1 DUF2817 domain-containing protein [Spirochaetota bacterium]HOS55532.1 DUF2817 domain-containing protein [Spirochaetota bacterium]HQF78095.1 DUF2817 domain-containing protein [Spirochaetota bacterium]HQH30888.1 DUF2817 domain-containing protein [Spirochaetota bacterium]
MKRLPPLFYLLALIISVSQAQEIDTIGYSLKNRSIKVYKFGIGDELICVVAGIHGNESNTTKTAYEIIELIKNRVIDVSDKSIWIIPEANPDGLARDRRLNDNDVDLNRNFETDKWKPTYVFFNNVLSAGSAPFSEPESICLKTFFESIKEKYKIVALSVHSRGDAIIPGDNSKFNMELLEILRKNSSYRNTSLNYDSYGELTTWLSSKHHIASATIELKTKTNAETSEIKKIIESLVKVNFASTIYGSSFLDLIFQCDNKDDNRKKILDTLPDAARNNIKNKKDKERFFKALDVIKQDQELVLLVNKTNLLQSNYEPNDLVILTKEFPSNKESFQLRKILLDDLYDMFFDAEAENIKLSIISAYRSYYTQKSVYNNWKRILGVKQADRVSAKPGASQHQLGTVIDFNQLDESFGKTKEGIWLYNNAYKYGFILSYPEGMEAKTGYAYEPWHYRYIGKEAAFVVYNFFENSLDDFLNWYWNNSLDY